MSKLKKSHGVIIGRTLIYMQNQINKTDQELVKNALVDKRTFSEIVLKYEAPMRRYARRLGCVDGNDLDDVLQEIFIKVFVNLNDYDASLKFSSWLYRIAHNETVSFFRKKNVRPGVLNLSTEEADTFFEQLADDKDSMELSQNRGDAETIQNILSTLEQKHKEVLVLRFLEEKSYTEISDILKVPEGTVATLIHRAKKALKVALESKGVAHI